MERCWWGCLPSGLLLFAATAVRAIYLDDEQNITLRARFYSQSSIRIEDSSVDTEPITKRGQLIQQRNFFNPELDAKLTSYTSWMHGVAGLDWLAPGDLRFRVTAWGFYDGIYDYGSRQFNTSQLQINKTFDNNVPCGDDPRPTGTCTQRKPGGWFIRGPNFKLIARSANGGRGALRFDDVFPGFELYEPRDIYANQARVNELYLSYTRGPVFVRIGRQSISWGESDTIALLDQTNPFDLTLAAPGFFEDIDEARIPLYTLRASYNLFDVLGPLSSGFVESYWVPGDWDATTPIVPLLTASPYSPRGVDPQLQGTATEYVFPPNDQFVFWDHIPKQNFGSSRWGFRFQTLVNRVLTLQTWLYRTFPTAPVPLHVGYAGMPGPGPIRINNTDFYIISLEHKPVMVYGVAGTFFAEPLDGIVRVNAQFFEHEAGFIPRLNLRICNISDTQAATCPNQNIFSTRGTIPYANILRWEVGFDRFFFLRWLNPTNSFVVVASAVGSWNTSRGNDVATDQFRFNGQLKPSRFRIVDGVAVPRPRGTLIDDYVNATTVDAQFQTTLQTDYMHGRLTPRLTLIQFVRGTFAAHLTLSYRWNDWLLFQGDWQTISGAYQSLGFYRDRDQLSFRVTYQLN
jgi:hypothetical protein